MTLLFQTIFWKRGYGGGKEVWRGLSVYASN